MWLGLVTVLAVSVILLLQYNFSYRNQISTLKQKEQKLEAENKSNKTLIQQLRLALEPNENLAAKTFQKALFEQGIPLTAFAVEDIQQEYERLKQLGVVFRMEPTKTEGPTIAVFDDTCGNFIQLYQV